MKEELSLKEVFDNLNDDEKSFKLFEKVNIWASNLNFDIEKGSTLEDLKESSFSTLKNYKLIVETKGTLFGTNSNAYGQFFGANAYRQPTMEKTYFHNQIFPNKTDINNLLRTINHDK